MTSLLDTRRPRLLLTLLCLALWMPGFFSIPPGDRDESRFAQGTKQMLETGDYVRIMNGTEARNRKPIGIYWMQVPFVAAAQRLGLAHDNPIWPYRIPSALGGLVAVLAAYGLGLRIASRQAALLGAGMLAASMALVVEVNIAKTDAALLGATTVAMALLGRAYLEPGRFSRAAAAWFWLAIGVGVLLKGPITPMVAGLAVLVLVVLDRRQAAGWAWLRGLRPAWGVPLMLLVVLPWFIAIELATGGRFVSDAVGGDLGRKLTSGDDAHWGPPGLHLALLPVLLFPAVVGLVPGVAAAWLGRRERAMRFLLAWIIPSWLVFEAAPTKLPHYTLPLYPAICLVVAQGVVAGVRVGGWRWVGVALAGLVAAGLAAGAIAAPLYLGIDPWVGAPAATAAVIVGWLLLRSRTPPDTAKAVVASILVYAAILGWELPNLWPFWIAPRIEATVPGMTPGARVGSVGFAEPSLMFLAGTGTQFLLANEAVAALADGSIDILLVGDRDLAAVQSGLAARGVTTRLLGVVPGFNYSRGRRVVVTALGRQGP
jgi:4-amino-4-deoxy-L-arabinose transferase-like glycosyltransferase